MLAYSFAAMIRLLLAALVVLVFAASAQAAVALARPDPGDITHAWPVPAPVEQLTRQDWFAYRAHVAFAAALRLAGAPPEAEAVQWLKAAVHASGEEQAANVRSGVTAARWRAADPAGFDAQMRRVVAASSDYVRARVAERVPGFPSVG
jgi:hypothetical protein